MLLLLFVVLYLLVTILIGWWSSRFVKNTSDFVIAGRKMPLMVVAASLFATWFGSETVMGASAAFVEDGLYGTIEDPFGAALCLFLVGVFVAKPLYRKNYLTFGDFFRERFSKRAELVGSIMMVFSYFGWIAAQLVALAIILQVLVTNAMGVDIPIWLGIIVCSMAVMIYTYIGGMWAVSVTDFVQTIMIIGGLLVLMIVVLQKAGGPGAVLEQTPPGFFKFLPDPHLNDILLYFSMWITIGLGSIPQQDVFQRVMSAKSEKTAIYGGYLSGFMYLTVAFMPLVIGLCGKILYPELLTGNDEDRQMLIPQMVILHSGSVLQILFFGALLSAILSTCSGAILAPATVLGENLIKPTLRTVSDKRLLFIMRWCVVGVTATSAVLASMSRNIYELVGNSSSLSLVSLFVPLIAGLYWKKASDMGTLFSMTLGFFFWFFAEVSGSAFSLLIGLCTSIVAMIAGSLMLPDKNESAGSGM